MALTDSGFHRIGPKTFSKTVHSHNGVMNPKSFNLYIGKLVNIKALGKVCSKNMLLLIKKIIFCEPSIKYIEISIYSNKTMLFAIFLK